MLIPHVKPGQLRATVPWTEISYYCKIAKIWPRENKVYTVNCTTTHVQFFLCFTEINGSWLRFDPLCNFQPSRNPHLMKNDCNLWRRDSFLEGKYTLLLGKESLMGIKLLTCLNKMMKYIGELQHRSPPQVINDNTKWQKVISFSQEETHILSRIFCLGIYTLPKFWRYNKVNLATSALSQTLTHFKIYIMQDEQVCRGLIIGWLLGNTPRVKPR